MEQMNPAKVYRNEHGTEIATVSHDLERFLLDPLANLKNLFEIAHTTQYDSLGSFVFLCSDYLERILETAAFRLSELKQKIGRIEVVSAAYYQEIVPGGTILDYTLTPNAKTAANDAQPATCSNFLNTLLGDDKGVADLMTTFENHLCELRMVQEIGDLLHGTKYSNLGCFIAETLYKFEQAMYEADRDAEDQEADRDAKVQEADNA